MNTFTAFRPNRAKDALPQREGDFLLPICLPKPGLLLGEDLAVLVLSKLEGQRVGVPMGMQALSDLREVVTEALRMLQAGGRGRGAVTRHPQHPTSIKADICVPLLKKLS